MQNLARNVLKAIGVGVGKKYKYTKTASVQYEVPNSGKITSPEENKKFSWWSKDTFTVTPAHPSVYASVLERFEQAYALWVEFKRMGTTVWDTDAKQYIWLSNSIGDRRVTIKSAKGDKYWSLSSAGTNSGLVFPISSQPSTNAELFFMRRQGSSWSFLSDNRMLHFVPEKAAEKARFTAWRGSPDDVWNVNPINTWRLVPHMGGFALQDVMVSGRYVSVNTSSGSTLKLEKLTTNTNPATNAEVFYIQDVSLSTKTGKQVGDANIRIWNEYVIPSLLSIYLNGLSPFVDKGRIGEIARSWEIDPLVDTNMLDAVKTDFCIAHPMVPECKCLQAAAVDPLFAKVKNGFPSAIRCWYANCSGLPGNGTTLVTQAMVKDSQNCPDVCLALTNIINSTNITIGTLQQITTCTKKIVGKDDDDEGDGGDDADEDRDVVDPLEAAAAAKKKKIMIIAGASLGGISIFAIVAFILFKMLGPSKQKKK